MTIPNTFTNGTTANATEVNANFTHVNTKIKEIYTGTGFNSTINSLSSNEGYHELTAVGSSTRDYVKIKITGTCSINCGNTSATVELKTQIKETGGAYADIVAYAYIDYSQGNDALNLLRTRTKDYTIVATLTAGMKTNGYQLKVFSKSSAGGTHGNSTSFTNIQTIVEETD